MVVYGYDKNYYGKANLEQRPSPQNLYTFLRVTYYILPFIDTRARAALFICLCITIAAGALVPSSWTR